MKYGSDRYAMHAKPKMSAEATAAPRSLNANAPINPAICSAWINCVTANSDMGGFYPPHG